MRSAFLLCLFVFIELSLYMDTSAYSIVEDENSKNEGMNLTSKELFIDFPEAGASAKEKYATLAPIKSISEIWLKAICPNAKSLSNVSSDNYSTKDLGPTSMIYKFGFTGCKFFNVQYKMDNNGTRIIDGGVGFDFVEFEVTPPEGHKILRPESSLSIWSNKIEFMFRPLTEV